MTSPLAFINEIDKALRSADPTQALRKWFERPLSCMRDEERTNYIDFLKSVYDAYVAHARETAEKDEDPDVVGIAEVNLYLMKGGTICASAALSEDTASLICASVQPDDYRLVLSTGWVLWERALTEEELLWQSAYPETDLPMAAEPAGGSEGLPATIEEILLDGELHIRIYPGLESGRLEVIRGD